MALAHPPGTVISGTAAVLGHEQQHQMPSIASWRRFHTRVAPAMISATVASETPARIWGLLGGVSALTLAGLILVAWTPSPVA